MNRCLCCGQPLDADGQYHGKCLKELYGKDQVPLIPFGLSDVPSQVQKTGNRMSISGVQMKLSVRVNPRTWEFETVAVGGTHILKPQPNQFPELPQNENTCMNIAADLRMDVPPHGLFEMGDKSICYIIRRFDRLEDGAKLAKETMYQVLGANDKYQGSLERVGREIRTHVTNVGLDAINFLERVLLSFLLGNGDMHLKNWALLSRNDNLALAPCYDFVSSKIYIPDEEESALTINGKRNRLRRADFSSLAANLKIDPVATENSFQKLIMTRDPITDLVTHSTLSADKQAEMTRIISSRRERLAGA
ncbi:MAG: HipA domain-containing protein [Anaerolineales bacterium]